MRNHGAAVVVVCLLTLVPATGAADDPHTLIHDLLSALKRVQSPKPGAKLLPNTPPLVSQLPPELRVPDVPPVFVPLPPLPSQRESVDQKATKQPKDRTSVRFSGPLGMKLAHQSPDDKFVEDAPDKGFTFSQGNVFRLRITRVLADNPARAFYPTLEVAPATPKTRTFLEHSAVPIAFTDRDFAQAQEGVIVVKVIYLPDPANQDFSTAVGAEEVVSTKLKEGADPVVEAQRLGTVLAIIRMGFVTKPQKRAAELETVGHDQAVQHPRERFYGQFQHFPAVVYG